MKLLIPVSEIKEHKSTEKTIPCECQMCSGVFYATKHQVRKAQKGKRTVLYCSHECCNLDRNKDKRNNVVCKNCAVSFTKTVNQIKKSPNHFCSRSCSVTYHNQNKIHGTRRSKLEAYLEEQLVLAYPEVEFHFNRKDTINSELDIYIPSLKLAFELNGIFHYEPIYGPDKLSQIQNNDQRKFQACLEQGIELCIIDTSGQSYFKNTTAQKFLNIIKSIVAQRTN